MKKKQIIKKENLKSITKLKKILNSYLSRKTTINQYFQKFNQLFSSLKTKNKREFDLIEELYWINEAFEPDLKIRKLNSDFLDEGQFKEEIKKFKEKLDSLLINKRGEEKGVKKKK